MARRRRARNLTTATEVGLFKNVDLEQAAVAAAKKAEAAVLKAALAVAKKVRRTQASLRPEIRKCQNKNSVR